jgi:3-hydroxyisobutyrate dehydrogenase-like beta-hydroxyacid dehydrogenase
MHRGTHLSYWNRFFDMKLRAVGLLSPGDMGHVVGQVLITHGMPVLTCLEGRSNRTKGLAAKAKIGDVPTYKDLVQDTDMILSIMVPGEAVGVARNVAKILKETGKTTVYIDCNAVSPATGMEIDNIIKEVKSKYVDASIIGGPPRRKGTTKFYASGPDVDAFMTLGDYGLEIRPLGMEVGQGKGIKMVYGALTKGLTAISTQLLMAAWQMGLYEALETLHEETQGLQLQRMKRAVPGMPNRSRRWVSEMEEIAKTYKSFGITPKMYEGAAEFYKFVGSTPLAEEKAETVNRNRTMKQVIEQLCERLP